MQKMVWNVSFKIFYGYYMPQNIGMSRKIGIIGASLAVLTDEACVVDFPALGRFENLNLHTRPAPP